MQDLIGHKQAIEFFARAKASEALHHAFLFVGPQQVGKSTLIDSLAADLLGVEVTGLVSHPDVQRIARLVDEKTQKQKTHVSVEQIRALRERLSMSAFAGGYQVAIIEDAWAMNAAASNALLKILEQPMGKVIFFLRATDTDELLDTITSRCQIIRLGHVARQEIHTALVARGASTQEATDISRLSLGRPGRAFELLAHPRRLAEHREQVEVLLDQLNKPRWQNMRCAASMVPRRNTSHDAISDQFHTAQQCTRDLLLASLGMTELQTSVSAPELAEHVTHRSPGEWAQESIRQLELERAFRSHINPTLLFENLLMHLSYEN